MVSKRPWGKGTEPGRNVGATKTGRSNAFAKTGKARPAQFSANSPGQREVGFTQKTEKTATAAMQGRPMSGGAVKAKPKNNGSRQFQNAPGRKVF